MTPVPLSPGIVNALALTPSGPRAVPLECVLLSGQGRLIVTGNLGREARESAQVALTLARSRSRHFGIPPADFHRTDVHFHVPGAMAVKNGPSAGLAMLVALVSAMIRKPVGVDWAFTGEISLSGRIYPVDWVREKSRGAVASGIRRIFLAPENATQAGKAIEVFAVPDADAVLHQVFGKSRPSRGAARKSPK